MATADGKSRKTKKKKKKILSDGRRRMGPNTAKTNMMVVDNIPKNVYNVLIENVEGYA